MRTTWNWLLAAALLAGGCASETSPPAPADGRPNIVFAFADDWGRYASAYREPGRPTLNDVLETPVFDRLANDGVLFWDAHVSAPSCTPSRTAVLTGRHFYRNGSGSQLHSPWEVGGEPDPVLELVSYHQLLEEAGYHAGITYKTHVASHLYGGEARQYNSAGRRFNRFSQTLSEGETEGERQRLRGELLDEVRGNLRAFLDDRAEGQPFAWTFSPTNPHRAWTQGSAQSLWGLDPADLEGKMPSFVPDVDVVRQDMADYLGECMAFDAALGVIVNELEAQGLLENTILVVSGDHGAPGFPRGKTNLFDFGTQVPLAIHWPAGIESPGRRIDNVMSLVDLAPTFLEAAGLPPHPQMDGRSWLAELRSAEAAGVVEREIDYVITGRERHVPQAREGFLPYPSRAIRARGHLYVRNFEPERWPMMTPPLTEGLATHGDFDGGPTKGWFAEIQDDPEYDAFVQWAWGKRPAEELYDLAADPDQVTNLAASAEHAELRAALEAQLFDVLRRTGDPRVVGEGDGFDRAPYLVPREVELRDGKIHWPPPGDEGPASR